MSKKSKFLAMTPEDKEWLTELIDQAMQRPFWLQIGVLH